MADASYEPRMSKYYRDTVRPELIKEFGYTGDFAKFKTLWCDHFSLDRGSFAVL